MSGVVPENNFVLLSIVAVIAATSGRIALAGASAAPIAK
jgi:hypothetical protein